MDLAICWLNMKGFWNVYILEEFIPRVEGACSGYLVPAQTKVQYLPGKKANMQSMLPTDGLNQERWLPVTQFKF